MSDQDLKKTPRYDAHVAAGARMVPFAGYSMPVQYKDGVLKEHLWTREHAGQDTTGVIAHSDKGVQYLAVRYTQRLAEAGAVASVGSTGDSYDNALAEAFNSLFKAELVRNKGPWKSIDDLEFAVAEYIDWFNHRRLHGEIGLVPPVEYENEHYRHNPAPTTVSASLQSLH